MQRRSSVQFVMKPMRRSMLNCQDVAIFSTKRASRNGWRLTLIVPIVDRKYPETSSSNMINKNGRFSLKSTMCLCLVIVDKVQ